MLIKSNPDEIHSFSFRSSYLQAGTRSRHLFPNALLGRSSFAIATPRNTGKPFWGRELGLFAVGFPLVLLLRRSIDEIGASSKRGPVVAVRGRRSARRFSGLLSLISCISDQPSALF